MSMPSKKYWINRAELALIMGEKDVLTYEKELLQAYENTQARLKQELEAFYGRYATEEGIPLSKAREILSPTATKDFKKRQKQYLAEVEALGEEAFTEKYRKKLKNMSARTYVTKLDEINAAIRHQIELLNTKYHGDAKRLLQRSYEDNFYIFMFDIQKNVGFGVDFTALGKEQLDAAISAKWNGANYSDRIWTNKEKLITELQTITQQEFVRGRGLNVVSREFANRMNVSYNNARRLIRTEFNHVANQATLQSYKDSGILEEYEYLATLDNRTSDICRELDGKIFKLSEAQTGVNLPPLHPHCRSTTIPYFGEDEELEGTERIARAADGSTYYVDGKMTFKDWAKEHASDAYATIVATAPLRYREFNKPAEQVEEEMDTETGLPITLEEYEAYAAEWLETNINPNYIPEQQEAFARLIKEVIDNNELSMRRGPRGLFDILENDRCKTQFETNTSSGALNPELRKQATQQLFGTNISKLSKTDFEKYGYLGNKDPLFELTSGESRGEYNGRINRMSQYGDWRIDFKKSAVKNRTTYTLDDSLGPALRRRVVAGKVSAPNLVGLVEPEHAKRSIEYVLQNDKQVYINNPSQFVRDTDGGLYFELLYHGELTTKNIANLYVLDETVFRDTQSAKMIIAKAKERGITTTIYSKRGTLSDSNSELLKEFEKLGAKIIDY